MLNFLNLKSEAFGLDISDLSLKIVKLKKKGKFFNLASFNEIEINPGIVKKGEIKKSDELAQAIKKVIKEVKGEKIRSNNAVVSLPEEKSFLQIVKMPNLSKQDMESAIIFEAENHIPLPIEEVYLDYQEVMSGFKNEKNNNILLVAFPKKIIDSYINCLKKAGIQIVALETESLALSRSLINKEKSDKPIMIIDFGSERTILTLFSGRSIKFAFSIPISSSGFTEVIARALKIDFKTAENLKIKYGLSEKIKLELNDDGMEKKEEKGAIFEALIPALTDLTEQTNKYLEYAKTYLEGEKVEKILVCGNGAKLKGLISFLSSELDILVESGNPWTNILLDSHYLKKQKLIYQKEHSLGYATVIGLALRGIKND